MLINVLNGSLKKVAILSNELPNAPSYYNDEFHDYLEQGATTFSFTVAKVINNQLQDYTQFLSDQSYFSFRKNGRDYLMTPSSEQSVHETSTEISFFCVSLDRELINEQANSLTNTANHNIQWYFDQMGLISRTQITIGINEVSNLTRVINYDAQESKLSRLISVINNFNAEFDFVTTLNNDGSLGTVVLNIYKENDGQNAQGVGTKRDDVRLTFGKNIEDVEVDISDDGFFNAAYMTGADGFSWKNYDFSYKNSDGVEEFYKRRGSEIAYAPLSAKMFPSQLKTDKGDIWTNSDRTTEYKNANDMWGYIVSQFKQYSYKQITYTVTPSSTLVNQLVGDGRPLQKGDTVIIQDDNYMDIDGNVGLILSARVSEIITSDTNPANNKIVFSNYKKLKSEASSDIKAIVSQLVNDATPYFADIATSNGVQFKNGTGSTTLSAHIYKGSATTETIADSYEWSKDGTVVANAQTITVDASGVVDKAVYSFKATVGGKVVASQSVTITNVNDGAKGAQGPQGPQGLKGDPGATGIPGQPGADGKTSYLHIAYATNSTGTAGFDVSNATGKTYIGQYTDFTSADSTDPSKYTWSLIKGDKGDTGPQGPQGERGIAGATGATGSLGPKGADGRSSYIHIKYAPVINPTDSQITDTPNAYIGVYTDYNQADGTSASAYTWSKWQGEDGANGVAGAKGADGRTTYVHFAYANSTNGQTNFSTSYFDGALYMGTLTDYTQTDSTNYAAYTWSRLKGDKGDKGDQGAQGIQGLQGPTGTQGVAGPKGADGKTQYTHIAYANSVDGVTDFSTSDSNRAYIGMYVDFNINDSTTPSDYSWTLVKGADGTQGTPGKPGANGKTPYFHTAWSYSADGTDRFTTVYPNLNLLHNWDSDRDWKSYTFSSWDAKIAYASLESLGLKVGDTITYSAEIDNTSGSIGARIVLFGIDSNGKPTFVINSNIIAIGSSGKSFITAVIPANTVNLRYSNVSKVDNSTQTTLNARRQKLEPGSTVTPYMQSAIEVTTADWPSYIGQYTDFTQADSTNPSDYTWSLIRGNDGKDGDMGKSIWTYPYDRGANRVGSWWSDLKPTPTTDSPPKVGDTIIDLVGKIYQITNVVVDSTIGGGGLFDYGPMLTSVKGTDGDPGKVVSNTEPISLFKGLTWKYSGTSNLTASDRTVILPGTEYYWSGTKWILNEINSHNINGDNLSVTNGTFTDGKIKSIWNSGVLSGSTEIKNSNINMSATDSTSNATNSLGLDVQQGFSMRWTDPASNQSRSVLLNYGGLVFGKEAVGAGLLFDGTNLSSSMPIQAPNTIVKSTQFSVSGIGIRLDRLMSFVAVTFFGQASSTISNSPTINNMIPAGFRPINPYSIDYMVPGNSANSGYIYFNPDGSIRIMATINSGYYIRGTRLYITNDVYPS